MLFLFSLVNNSREITINTKIRDNQEEDFALKIISELNPFLDYLIRHWKSIY